MYIRSRRAGKSAPSKITRLQFKPKPQSGVTGGSNRSNGTHETPEPGSTCVQPACVPAGILRPFIRNLTVDDLLSALTALTDSNVAAHCSAPSPLAISPPIRSGAVGGDQHRSDFNWCKIRSCSFSAQTMSRTTEPRTTASHLHCSTSVTRFVTSARVLWLDYDDTSRDAESLALTHNHTIFAFFVLLCRTMRNVSTVSILLLKKLWHIGKIWLRHLQIYFNGANLINSTPTRRGKTLQCIIQ